MTLNRNLYRTPCYHHTQHHPSIATPSSSYRQLSTKKPSPYRPSALWKSLKAPALFGGGLYLGLMIFGEHRETKQESAYFEELRNKFRGSGDGR
mmetsp:Transcript_13970/g.25226  ORF Transcript_13970/g.25226 Transcript_13970/m.25226 type:complete len:94 (+) Transcript_13970:199-480(+)